MKTVCFTGHRNSPNTPEMRQRVNDLIEALIADGADTFCAGGAKGWDNDCSDIVLSLKNKYPHIKLCVILPCPEAVQTENWTQKQKEQYRRIISQADTTEICSENKNSGGEKIRNARLVELADCFICCLNPSRRRSGTYQTVRMANSKGIRIYNLY